MTGVCGRRLLVRFLTRVVWTRAIGRGDALAAGQRAGRAGCAEQRAGGRRGRAALPLPGRFLLRLWKQRVGVEGATV